MGRGRRYLTSRVTTLLESNVQMSAKKSQGTKRYRKTWPIQKKRVNQQKLKQAPEKDLVADKLDRP